MAPSDELCLTSQSLEETRQIGRRLGELARAGDLFILTGKLGAGKTTLTQGIALGLGIKENVLSPTFVLIRELAGRLTLYHIDLYRLDRLEEIQGLGLDDYLYGNGVSVIEWGEKGAGFLPEVHLLIELSYTAENERSLRLKAYGERYRKIIRQLKAVLK
ncbi:MAG: tRNA (adenosine(37)-N6)-threonylcarbamoyltransferase complex ATPase subunit type 1 TsaE [Chloroflexota bacterium]